jgi:hypothetical protein
MQCNNYDDFKQVSKRKRKSRESAKKKEEELRKELQGVKVSTVYINSYLWYYWVLLFVACYGAI